MELRTLIAVVFKMGHQAMEKRLAEHDPDMSGFMSRLQFGVMMIIAHAGPQTISELSRKLSVDPSTLVPSVDALERKGLIVRGSDPTDRRRTPLSHTEAGEAFLHQIKVMGDDDPILIGLQKMGPDNVRQLLVLLCELIRNLPESRAVLDGVQSRLYAYGAKEEYLVCKQLSE
jgi:DNA-binding MarR family transcriptional regulator